jgi:hypothetical protein
MDRSSPFFQGVSDDLVRQHHDSSDHSALPLATIGHPIPSELSRASVGPDMAGDVAGGMALLVVLFCCVAAAASGVKHVEKETAK